MHPQTLVPDTLHYAIQQQCDKTGKKTCFITFDQPLYIKVPSTMRSIHELSSVVACLVGFLPLTSFIDVMRYVMFQLLWAQQACLCQDFSSANDVRSCIQPHTASPFSNTAGLASIPLSQTSITHLCKIYQDGVRCIADAVKDPGVVTICAKHVLGNIVTLDMKARLWDQLFNTFSLVQHFIQSECRWGLVFTSGDHQKETAFISC